MFTAFSPTYNIKGILLQICSDSTLIQELRKNDSFIQELGTIIDNIDKLTEATSIIELRNGLKSQVLVISKDDTARYRMFVDNRNHKVDIGTSFTHHCTSESSLHKILGIEEIKSGLDVEDVLSYTLSDTPSGLKIIAHKAKTLINLARNEVVDDQTQHAKSLFKDVIAAIKDAKKKAEAHYVKFVEGLEEPNLKLEMNFIRCVDHETLAVGEITKVVQVGNTRYCEISYSYINDTNHFKGDRLKTAKFTPNTRERTCVLVEKGIYEISKTVHGYYTLDESDLVPYDIPYNLIDEGRIFVSSRCERCIKTWFSEDPKIDKDLKDNFIANLSETFKHQYLNTIAINDSTIGTFAARQYVTETTDGSTGNFQALKKMVNEFRYITQKKKALGSDVSITDKIRYQHTNGKIIYGDFSIATDNELMKNDIQEFFSSKLLVYFRGDEQEEEILNGAIATFFSSLESSLINNMKESVDIDLVINEKINIRVASKVFNNKSRFFYINEQRVNRNEVSLMLKEISCYRDAASANAFLNNVGRIGLSVYMGVTSGYTANLGTEKLFKFKKLKGRSNYELILENACTKIKGKKLISYLYEQFLTSAYKTDDFKNKIDNIIKDTSTSTSEFIRYKLLIDDTYISFKKKSEEVLEKKITEVEGERIKFLLKRTEKDAVLLKGTSGNTYVVAYDSNGSWVFMNPIKEGELYKDGSYVCMIDQSNVKSSFSYDTVIAKIMALKNDSVIAKQIYNLDEALGGFDGEEGEETTN